MSKHAASSVGSTVNGGEPAGYRCLFVVKGGFSHSNDGILNALRSERPDISFEVFDLAPALSGRRLTQLRCLIGAVAEYGIGSLRSLALLRYRYLRSVAFYRATRRLIQAKLAEHDFDFTIQTQSLFNAADPGKPHFIYTDHVARARETSAWDEGVGLASPAWLELEREIYGAATHVFTFGSKVRQMLVDLYGLDPNRTSAIGGGASVTPTRAPDTSLDRYAQRRILFVGIDWERKGGPELIAAFRRVRTALPDATLTIVGCSPDLQVEGCTVLGRLSRPELEAQYHEHSCFCMPTKLEPYGVVFAEAHRFGLPAVATDVGDISEIVADGITGRLVPSGDVEALAARLIEVLNDPLRCRAMGQAALRRADRFTWEAVAHRFAQHLPAAASPTPARREALG